MPDAAPPTPPRFTVAMLAYPGITLLDLVGPQAAWGFHADTYIVWATLDPVLADTGVSIVPTHTFETCPRGVDILFVPGGFGTWAAMGNEAALQFLREQAQDAGYVTSVCTGSLILAAAGLIAGRRATTHWSAFPFLSELGVEGVHARVVTDGNLITGGGVTAGIDFGLTVLAELRGEAVAKATQLMLEYDPEPPFNAGSPARAGEEVTGQVNALLSDDMTGRALPAVAAAKQRLAALTAWPAAATR